MKLSELQFNYPETLVATSPQEPCRVMFVNKSGEPSEISKSELLDKFNPGDLLVVNDTLVLKRRVFAENGSLEILFLKQLDEKKWEVLFPSKKYKIGSEITLPQNKKIKLLQKGRPQIVESESRLTGDYFNQVGELPLPPYIQKARDQRHTVEKDASWYQTGWAKEPGSLAAPTASLHFTSQDFEQLKQKGVHSEKITLHVGLGTFLPVATEDLNDHKMHEEDVRIPKNVWQKVIEVKENQKGTQGAPKIWALGTTVTRALESASLDKLKKNEAGDLIGSTNLLIQPGFNFQIVDVLMTNFHQPESTLLALVAGFSSLETVKNNYEWAVQNKYRLFSYGDLSVWEKPSK